MTNRQIVSEIVSDLNAYNLDDRVSQRYILSKLKGYAALFIKRENDLFRLFNQQDIWTTINCVQMIPVDIKECCSVQIRDCNSAMKSKIPIPGLYTYKNGPIIRELASLDGSIIFLPTTPQGFKRIQAREFKDETLKYYWFENNYLIIPNSQVEYITLTGFFENAYEAEKLSCDYEDNNSPCKSPLDDEFQCPSHLISVVKQETLKDLFNFYKRVTTDTNPNLDLNQKQGKIES